MNDIFSFFLYLKAFFLRMPFSVYKDDIHYDSCEKICQVCLLGRRRMTAALMTSNEHLYGENIAN
jgi:hypothetical protein